MISQFAFFCVLFDLRRIVAAGYHVERYPHNLTRYTTLRHRGTTYNHNWYARYNLVYEILHVSMVLCFGFCLGWLMSRKVNYISQRMASIH